MKNIKALFRLNFLINAVLFILQIQVISASLLFVFAGDVQAHGERAQEPFLRMRTIQWYDVSWSTSQLAVNETLIVKGRFRVSKYWPDAIAKPDVAFLNISVPGPVFVRTGSFINGVNMMNSTSLERGRDYEWEVHLKARHPGRWHVHSLLNVKDAGPIIGPGKYIEITGKFSDFKNEITTITGKTIDLDSYGLSNNIRWHVVWAILALIWVGYWLSGWVSGPLLFKRYQLIKQGKADLLITKGNKRFAVIMLAASLSITFGSYQWAESQWPITIALQSSRAMVDPLPILKEQVKVKLIKGIYRVPGRAMDMKIEVTNNTDQLIRLGEFNTATVRFINPVVGLVDKTSEEYPEYLLARHGLTVSDNTPIKPGETRVIKIIAQDAAWVTERLSSLIYDPDSRFAGLLFFYDEENKRYISSVGGVLSPRFI